MIMAPPNIPADPKPAIARPTMKAVDVGAAPHTTDPSSNRPMAAKKTHLGE